MEQINKSLDVFVTIRFSTKTGKIDTTITSKGCALAKMWALNNTKSTKTTVIVHRETGKIMFACRGKANDFPTIAPEKNLGNCEDIGIPLDYIHSIKDDRFDKEEVV